MNKLQLTFSLALVATLFYACEQKSTDSQENENSENMEMQDSGDMQAATGSESTATVSFADQNITNIVQSYLNLKDALVATDGEQASQAAKNLLNILENSSTETKESMKATVQQIAETTDTEVQRIAFDIVSQQILILAKTGEITEGKLYKQYCPMAKNNEGAFWLSASDQIRNPYFGDKMLNCGSVEEEI